MDFSDKIKYVRAELFIVRQTNGRSTGISEP